jgi:FkbM family methyltransferase
LAYVVEIEWDGRKFGLQTPSERDHIARVTAESGTFYEAEMLRDARSRLFYAKCAVDVGANIGNHTLFFAGVLGLRTIAFEPSKDAFDLLTATLETNSVVERCVLHQAAAGNAKGAKARLEHVEPDNSGRARVMLDPKGDVPVVRLDDVLDTEPQIDLIKIDTEGSESNVLAGQRARSCGTIR